MDGWVGPGGETLHVGFQLILKATRTSQLGCGACMLFQIVFCANQIKQALYDIKERTSSRLMISQA